MLYSGIGSEAGVAIDQQLGAIVELGWEHIDLRNIDNVNITRIAVMGPDSRILLRSLEISDDQLQNSGSHLEIDTIMEPVRVCHSDFAGPHGYDFIIPIEPYNMILAVICDWGVRLGMNLIPVGWAALQETARKHRKFEFNLKHLNNKTKCILPVSETS